MIAASWLEDTRDPRLTMALLARAIEGSEPVAALGWFAEDACLISARVGAVRGRSAIGASLELLLGRPRRIEIEASSMESARGMAVGTERWRLRYGDPVAAPRRVEVTVVLRRLEAGWRLVLATLAEPVARDSVSPRLAAVR